MLTLRNHKISRLEEFSDAVFGFALTLLVITVAALAWFGPLHLVFLAPMGFALMGPAHWGFGQWVERRRQALEAAAARNNSQVT